MSSCKRALVVALLLAGCGPAGLTYTVRLNEQYGHLPNGVRVILLPDKSSPLVEVDVRYDVGSKDDPPGREGMAHLVEHLLFLQRQAGPDQPTLGAVLRQHSISHNAMTSQDSTHYQTLARASELGSLLAIEGMRLATGCDTLTAEALNREREVVKVEVRMRTGSPEARLYADLHEIVYPAGHAYHRVVGGNDASLDAITMADVCAFVQAHYVPERATVVVAGNFAEAEVQREIARGLGGVPARPGGTVAAVAPLAIGKKRVTREVEADESSVIVAWPLPSMFGRDAYTIPLVSSVVVGRTETFNNMYDFAAEVESMILGGPRAPVLAVRLTLKKGGDPQEAIDSVMKFTRHAHWGLQHTDLGNARAAMLGRMTIDLESLGGRAVTYADYAQFDPQGSGFGGQIELLKKLDGDQLKKVVRDVLDEDKAMVIVLKGKPGKETAGVAQARFSAGAEPRDELPIDGPQAAMPIEVPGTAMASQARRFELKNGLKVILLRTEAPMPVITAAVMFGVGAGHNPPTRRGMATVVGTSVAVAGRSEHVDVDVDVTPDSTRFTAHTVSLYPTEILETMFNLVNRTRVHREVMEGMRKGMERFAKRRRVRSGAAMTKALGEAVYGKDHPYVAAFDPIVAATLKVDEGDARAWARKHYSARNATLVVTGVFDAAEVEKTIRGKFGDWPAGAADAPITTPARQATGPVVVGVAGDNSALVDVRVAYAVGAGMDKGYAARLVLREMLDRRVATVRERLGAAYSVNAVYTPTVGPAIMGVAGAFDGVRAGEALTEVRAAFDALRRGEGFLDDFVRARASVLARQVSSSSESFSLAMRLLSMATFGLAPEAADGLAAEIARLGPRDVLVLARQELDPAHEVIVCEGPRAALDRTFADAKLAGATIVEVKP